LITDIIFQFGYPGLFVVSFLSATLLPLASEVIVVAMPRLGYNAWLVILFATSGSFLGSLTNYYVGRQGSDFLLSRYIKIKPQTLARAEKFYQRWGVVTLFFSWLPFLGDPLTIVAGAFHTNPRIFTFWVLLGKTLRYIVLLGIANRILEYV
jgi:membrane protein YqaA with SNARE-associated domain